MRNFIAPAMAGLAVAVPAFAQEAMFTQAATMPSPGSTIVRTQFMWYRYGSHPVAGTERTDVLEPSTIIAYGVDRGLAAYLDVPVSFVHEDTPDGGNGHEGLDNLDLMLKWRVYKHDSGGVDTVRVALLGGVEMSFEDEAAVHPKVGAVLTMVRGRHGFNVDAIYHWTTDGTEADNFGAEGPADALAMNTSYLYRIAPTQYTSESTGAWYVTAEINALYETNGDLELRWAPGLMYEGREFAFELMAQFPLWEDVDRRATLEFAVGFGFRFLF
ncbi:MAG: hypothetical protein HBSAPP03_14130 [Phycisphaerae bacterium]|nr:MAG: hypothetical protein HBSAPP03_14130 [Phycisphaerae bacterium]